MFGIIESRVQSIKWLLATVFTVLLLGVVPLIWHRRFYFQDDTENGAYGVWYHLGESLAQGTVPILNPHVWSSGNYTAEGQWGTWNPLVMLIGLAVYAAGNAVVVSTILKIAMLVTGAIGCYFLARSFSVHPALAYIVGISVPINGFTMFFDAPSWVTGLLAWSLLPFFWLELRSMLAHRRNPFWAFLFGYLIVTIGYVAGTVAVGFVLLAVGIDSLLRRRWGRAIRIASIGVALVLVAVVVYLPGVLTAGVTNRSTASIANDNFMGVNLSGLAMSTISTAFPMMPSWWWQSTTAPAPAMYIAWFLPLVAFLSWGRIRTFAPTIRDLLFFITLAGLFVLLPTTIGPLRYPARFMPYVAMAAILLCIVLFSHARSERPSKLSLFGAWGAICLGTYSGWAQFPDRYRTIWVTGVVACIGLWLIWRVLRHKQALHWRWGAATLVAIIIGSLTVGTLALQQRTTNGSPLSNANTPADTSISKNVLSGVEGDVLVVGDPLDYSQDNTTWSRTLMANSWYLSEASVQNRYQLIGFTEYNQKVCLRYLGGTCAELLDALFDRSDQTEKMLVDVLGVDNIQILKKSFDGNQFPSPSNNYVGRSGALPIRSVPEGWHEVSDDGSIALWSRDVPLGPPGGIVWTSEGTQAREIHRSDTEVKVFIDDIPNSGGKIAFSRLAWPGYEVDGASLGKSIDGYLLTTDVPAAAKGTVITVRFIPPGWKIGVPLWSIAVGGMLIWSVASGTSALRRRQNLMPASVA